MKDFLNDFFSYDTLHRLKNLVKKIYTNVKEMDFIVHSIQFLLVVYNLMDNLEGDMVFQLVLLVVV